MIFPTSFGRRTQLRLLFLAVCLISSLALVAAHISSTGIFGCGGGSPCARLAESEWGKVPFLGWPVSFIGFSYFTALILLFRSTQGCLPRFFQWIIRFSALVSVFFLSVFALEKTVCPYCLAVHLSNMTFWILSEKSPADSPAFHLKPLVIFTIHSGIVLAFLLFLDMYKYRAAIASAHRELDRSTSLIASGSEKPMFQQPVLFYNPAGGFTGRYCIGPEKARIRLVIYSDYQCSDCRKIDLQVREVMKRFQDISFSAKHFPMSSVCNTRFQGRNPHPNSCWAARAAEAGGILKGSEGFRQVHEWLFDRGGSFTSAELDQALLQMGFDPAVFTGLMTQDATLDPVESDITEAVLLGLHYTPMIFINGVELKGWSAPDAIMRAVESLLSSGLGIAGPESDRPPLALQKHFEDWSETLPSGIPSRIDPHILNAGTGQIPIIIFGDYLEPYTRMSDLSVREMLKHQPISYEFRHCPYDAACNPNIQRTIHAGACLMAAAAETASILGGNDAFWRMHEWLMSLKSVPGRDQLDQAAAKLGLDARKFTELLHSPQVGDMIAGDLRTAQAIGIKSIPAVFIQNRLLPRNIIDGRSVIPDIINIVQYNRVE